MNLIGKAIQTLCPNHIDCDERRKKTTSICKAQICETCLGYLSTTQIEPQIAGTAKDETCLLVPNKETSIIEQ